MARTEKKTYITVNNTGKENCEDLTTYNVGTRWRLFRLVRKLTLVNIRNCNKERSKVKRQADWKLGE